MQQPKRLLRREDERRTRGLVGVVAVLLNFFTVESDPNLQGSSLLALHLVCFRYNLPRPLHNFVNEGGVNRCSSDDTATILSSQLGAFLSPNSKVDVRRIRMLGRIGDRHQALRNILKDLAHDSWFRTLCSPTIIWRVLNNRVCVPLSKGCTMILYISP